MKSKKVDIRESSWLAKLAARKLKVKSVAITVGNTIYLHNVSIEKFQSDEQWVRHEMEHVHQFRRYGFLQFIFLYLWESLKHGYYNNRFEIEARNAENVKS